jgi:hypothetical protein
MDSNQKACSRQRLACLPVGHFLAISFLVVGLSALPIPSARTQDEQPANQATQNPPDQQEARPAPEAAAPPRELAPDITADLRDRVTDRTSIPHWYKNNPTEEAKAYCQALIAASQTSAKAFANSARHDVTFAHLFEEPEKYRGQVIHFNGRLKRVRRFDPPDYVKGDVFGIKDLYEGWIFDPEIHGANPVCIVFTQLPAHVSVAEDMEVLVAFDAYFFKRYRYKAKDGLRECPLFIGHTLQVKKVLAASTDSAAHSISAFTTNLVIAVLLMFLGTIGLALLLSWWYRRGDRRIHKVLADARMPEFPEPDAPADDVADHVPASNGYTNGHGLSTHPDSHNRLGRDNMNVD